MGPWLIYLMIFVSPVLALVAGTGVVHHQRLHPEHRGARSLKVAVVSMAGLLAITTTFVVLVLAPLLARP